MGGGWGGGFRIRNTFLYYEVGGSIKTRVSHSTYTSTRELYRKGEGVLDPLDPLCNHLYGEHVASSTCRVDIKVHKPHPLYTKYSNTYSSLYMELYLGGVCTISCTLPCTTLHALSPVNLQWSTLVDLDTRHHLHCSVNCHGLDSCSYAVCTVI